MWLFHFLMKGSFAAALNERLCLKPTSSSNLPRAKEGMLRTYAEVVKYLLQTYATNDIVKSDAALTSYIKPLPMPQTKYAEALVANSLRFGEVYD